MLGHLVAALDPALRLRLVLSSRPESARRHNCNYSNAPILSALRRFPFATPVLLVPQNHTDFPKD